MILELKSLVNRNGITGKRIYQSDDSGASRAIDINAYREAKWFHEALDKMHPGENSFESIYEDFLKDQIELNEHRHQANRRSARS